MLISDFLELLKPCFVEIDVLLDVNLIVLHDVLQAVGNLVHEILTFSLVHEGHELQKKLGVLLVEKFAGMLDLAQIRVERLLIVTNVTLHYLTDIAESFVGFRSGLDNFEEGLIITSNSVLKL